MYKDYSEWMNVKREINNKIGLKIKYFKEKDIWWANIGENVGFEEDGKGEHFLRPVLILRKFNQNLLLSVSLSNTNKEGIYYSKFKSKKIQGNVLLSQIRTIDSARLTRKMGMVSDLDFNIIKEKLRKII